MVGRPQIISALETAIGRAPVTALLGLRQCGKTTLARILSERQKGTFFDLESEVDAAQLRNPMMALAGVSGLVVIDEIQRRPELFQLLRVLSDRDPLPCRFLILGSASPDLIRGASESLAGRIEFVDMAGFDLTEVGQDNTDRLWVRGGLPRSFLARSEEDSLAWRRNFGRTFLERDIPQLGLRIPVETLRRFWTMLAHYHGQTWNASEIAGNFGLTDKTVRHYLDILCGTFMVRLLPPWYENVGKRQVKAPKVYLRDSGVLHSLLDIADKRSLLGHPKAGASWEGFALEQVLRRYPDGEPYFWNVHGGPELDLLLLHKGQRTGYEFKMADAPTATRSMHAAIETLRLDRLWVVYPGPKRYNLDAQITAVPVGETGPG
jgi:predicted AAA+ superfamily ATPase